MGPKLTSRNFVSWRFALKSLCVLRYRLTTIADTVLAADSIIKDE